MDIYTDTTKTGEVSTGHNQGEDNLFYLLNGGEYLDIFLNHH